MTDSPPAMPVRDVAAYLNVNEKTVYRLAQRGELPAFKVAGAWRFQRDDLEGWIATQKRKVAYGKGYGATAPKQSQARKGNGGSAAR